MKLYRNVASGRLFIGISEDLEVVEDADGLLLITPEGKIKQLEEHLFEPVDGGEAATGKEAVIGLTREQREKHHEVLSRLLMRPSEAKTAQKKPAGRNLS